MSQERKKLKEKLWNIFSQYIRIRYSNMSGYVNCVTCGVLKHWKELDAGHYIPKTKGSAIYFTVRNVHPQCIDCNRFKAANLAKYRIYLKRTYGDKIFEELQQIAARVHRYSIHEYKFMIDVFTVGRDKEANKRGILI